jgi:MFS family permease
MTYRYLPESRDPDAASFDVPGQTLAMLGLGTLTIVLVEGRTLPPAWTVALAVAAVAGIAAFVWSQRRVAHPMLPLDLFRSSRLVAALIATFTMTFGIYGLLLVNSFAFQQQRGATALETALWFLPMPVTYLVLIPVVNTLAHRTGPRLPMTAGLTLMAAGMALYAAVGSQADVWLIELSFVLAGAGLALNTGPAVGLAMSSVPVQRAGLASGVVNLARLVGITVGVAVLGSAMAAIAGAEGARIATMLGGLVQLTGAAVALRWARADTPAPMQKEVCHA